MANTEMISFFWRASPGFPFSPLQNVAGNTEKAATLVTAASHAVLQGDQGVLAQLQDEATDLKSATRAQELAFGQRLTYHAPSPRARRALLQLIADQAEVVAEVRRWTTVLTLRPLGALPPAPARSLQRLAEACAGTIRSSVHVLDTLDLLLRFGLKKPGAVEAQNQIERLRNKKAEAAACQSALFAAFFQHEQEIQTVELFLWGQVFDQLWRVAQTAGRCAVPAGLLLQGHGHG